MPYLIPSRTPLTPEQVERGFDYLLTLRTGGEDALARQPEADPALAFVLPRLAEDMVRPVLRRATTASRAFADSADLISVVRHGLRQLQYRPAPMSSTAASPAPPASGASHHDDITHSRSVVGRGRPASAGAPLPG
ncbi:hypothetical protein [Streptomyces sp. NPDC047841]|uniref:hypothetical protein n=1 Tax=Streptomyces sp. NPDC047841 TaxID=3154708 RepID=UPI0034515E04